MCALTTRIYNIGRIRVHPPSLKDGKKFFLNMTIQLIISKGKKMVGARMECVQEGHVVPTFPQVVDMTLKAAVQVVITQPTARFFSSHDSGIELVNGRTAGHFGIQVSSE